MSGEDDVAFRLLHTADWHLGKRFPSFDEPAEKDLRRARLDVLSEVFAAATRSVVDAVLSGAHERGTSHYELLRAFLDDGTLAEIDGELEARGYRTHEFGDSVFVETTIRRSQVSRATDQGSQMNMSVNMARR